MRTGCGGITFFLFFFFLSFYYQTAIFASSRNFCKFLQFHCIKLHKYPAYSIAFFKKTFCIIKDFCPQQKNCSCHVLVAPWLNQPFKLQVDASHVGAGAVLLQAEKQVIEHPVSFFSKEFNSYKPNYSVIDKEALALIFALQHFYVYLDCGMPMVVFTDHNPLTFLNSLQNPNQ